jgi:hypothetical protein
MTKEKKREYNRQYRIKNKKRLQALERKRQLDPKRRERRRIYQREWYKKNKDYFRKKAENNKEHYIVYRKKWRLKKKEKEAGIKRPEKCEICGNKDRIVFDHDHKTGEFRGWICSFCNCALGYAKDDIKRLKLMIKYLQRNGKV